MLKTNCKQAIDNIRAYILEHFDCSAYDEEAPEGFQQTAEYIMRCFYHEKVEHDKRNLSLQTLFIEWLAGLPTSLDACYYYNRSAIKDVGDILEETEEERSKYTEKQACELLSCLIYREVSKVCHFQMPEVK